MTTQQYIENLNKLYQTGRSKEHAYRGDLQLLIKTVLKDFEVINEPSGVNCGNPDYMISKKDVPIGYIEAKDIGLNLESKSYKEQFDRYKSLPNIIFTDYLEFQFWKYDVFVTKVRIGEIKDGIIQGIPSEYKRFEELILDFSMVISQSINSPTRLAELMAGKAKLMGTVIENALNSDVETQENSQLKEQFQAFKNVLVHDITHKGFADMYAQTIAYGMFAARYHDPTLPTFSREEAATLIPHSNPFLRKLFQSIAGYDLDKRILLNVNDLVQIFLASDVAEIMRNFGKRTKQEDPIIHFYETFLAAYDPSLRKSRGVWYTPEPVVNFLVRAVDDILKKEFNLPQGLADTSKTKIKIKSDNQDKRTSSGYKEAEIEVHKVQVLDPATGTGTFLAEVIKHIHQKFKNQAGIWPKYVENDLIPRLNGFELLMTSYAMAHLKMDILLTETGFTNPNNKRFKIFLTNSLEEAHENQFNLFTQWLSQEANEANAIKKETPVMCVIGNPPYSISSSNKSVWIENLVNDYKKDLKEKSYNSLSDDYVKFIRFGQHFIDKNGEGILAYISNNSFIDGITHRQMRKKLLESFDKIYILDLHGNAKKKEVSPDGSSDQNVFDIMAGVSINIFIKTGKKKKNEIGKVYHFDLFGKRVDKYSFLESNNLNSVSWNKLAFEDENFYFVSKDYTNKEEYDNGFELNKLIVSNFNPGIECGRDDFFIDYDQTVLEDKIEEVYKNKSDETHIKKYGIKDTPSFKFATNLKNATFDKKMINNISYRPFDLRKIYYDPSLLRRPSFGTFQHILQKNLGIVIKRGFDEINSAPIFLVKNITDRRGWSRSGMQGAESVGPLYLYEKNDSQVSILGSTRKSNLNNEIIEKITKGINHTFMPDDDIIVDIPPNSKGVIYPLDIVDYIYAVLHSPSYREKYKEFLKIDFPRVPYPTDADKFWKLVALGKELREIHLLESPRVEEYITGYPEDGDNIVGKPRFVKQPVTEHSKIYPNF